MDGGGDVGCGEGELDHRGRVGFFEMMLQTLNWGPP